MGCLHVGRNANLIIFPYVDIHIMTGFLQCGQLGKSYWVLDGRWLWCLGHVSWPFLVGANYSTWKQHGGRRTEQETNHIKNTNKTARVILANAISVQVKCNKLTENKLQKIWTCHHVFFQQFPMTMHPQYLEKNGLQSTARSPFSDGRIRRYFRAFRHSGGQDQ